MLRDCGGPSGYSSEKYNAKLIRCTDYYKIRLEDFTTIGGIIISRVNNSKGYIQRMYIDITFQNQGIGQYAMDYIQKDYGYINEWVLETPSINVRTNAFYTKCGFKAMKIEKGFTYYTKGLISDTSHLIN